MTRIKEWTAKRAGGRITIDGVDADNGGVVKITGVDRIDANVKDKKPVAYRYSDGTKYELV